MSALVITLLSLTRCDGRNADWLRVSETAESADGDTAQNQSIRVWLVGWA
jgi:hypothetical protein